MAFDEYDCETLKNGYVDIVRGLPKATLAQRCTSFGRALETGKGIGLDEPRARLCYQAACDSGHAQGCERLARMRKKTRP